MTHLDELKGAQDETEHEARGPGRQWSCKRIWTCRIVLRVMQQGQHIVTGVLRHLCIVCTCVASCTAIPMASARCTNLQLSLQADVACIIDCCLCGTAHNWCRKPTVKGTNPFST